MAMVGAEGERKGSGDGKEGRSIGSAEKMRINK
jgi:hypothetical protein